MLNQTSFIENFLKNNMIVIITSNLYFQKRLFKSKQYFVFIPVSQVFHRSKVYFSQVFRGSIIFFRGYFVGFNFLIVWVLRVQNFCSWVLCWSQFLLVKISCVQIFILLGIQLVPIFYPLEFPVSKIFSRGYFASPIFLSWVI